MRRALVGAALAIATLVPAAPAQAQVNQWRQPYGGCVEAHGYIHSPGARACRRHGWTIRRWIVVSPNKDLRYLGGTRFLCRTEDSRRCVWLADEQGNGHGRSFWTGRNGKVHYLRRGIAA